MSALADLFLLPKVLLAGVAAAVLLAVLVLLASRQSARRRESLVAPALATRVGLRPDLFGLKLSLAVVAALGIAAALARPRWGETTELASRRGSDVVLLLDTSASMRAADVTPSRFVLARQAAASLLDKLAGDRIALVACEGDAQVLLPLTLDMAAAGLFLDALEPGVGTRPGTSLAAGIAAAAELFPAGNPTGRHVVLISDGEDLEGGLDEAIAKAKREGITVHTVFVGVPGRGAPVPETDVAGRITGYKAGPDGAPVLSRANPDLLKRLAVETGGSFSKVAPGQTDLFGVASVIDRTARRSEAEKLVTTREERFQIPLAVAVAATGLLLLGAASLRLPRLTRRAAAALALVAILSGRAASAQAPGAPGSGPLATTGSPSPPAPAPSPVPPPQTLLSRMAAHPPFTTARSEAKAGKAALSAQKPDEAIARFAHEVELSPKDPTGAYNLGTALSSAGKKDEALASLERARQGAARDLAADTAYNTGQTLYRANDFGGAARAFREAVRLRSGDPDASWNYELCLRRAEEQKKKQSQNSAPKQGPKPGATPSPTPGPKPADQKNQEKEKQQQDREFEQKAKMSREKADQLLSAINQADLEEQRKKLAEQRNKRRVARDW